MLVLTALAPIVALIALWRYRHSSMYAWTVAGFLSYLIGVMVLTVVLNVPINNEMLAWDPSAPPANWADLRDQWDLLNTIRTPISFFAFFAYLRAMRLMARTDATADARAQMHAA